VKIHQTTFSINFHGNITWFFHVHTGLSSREGCGPSSLNKTWNLSHFWKISFFHHDGSRQDQSCNDATRSIVNLWAALLECSQQLPRHSHWDILVTWPSERIWDFCASVFKLAVEIYSLAALDLRAVVWLSHNL